MNYEQSALLFKVLSDKNRLEIIDLLSCGPLCACDILAYFEFSQPTLSHHMKQLKEAAMVNSWKQGNKVMYELNVETAAQIIVFNKRLFEGKERCICTNIPSESCAG